MISCFTTQIFLVKQRLDTSHDTSTNISKIYSKCGVAVNLSNKRNTYINESHFGDTLFKRHHWHCVHEIITLAISAQFAFTFRSTLLRNFLILKHFFGKDFNNIAEFRIQTRHV